MRPRSRPCRGRGLVALLVGLLLLLGAASAARADERLVLPVDRATLIDVRAAITKVAVTTPGIADVHVINPTQLLVNAKAAGATSLVIFSRGGVRRFEVIVHPAPILSPGTPLVDAPHGVTVQRADRVSRQLFGRDAAGGWWELGSRPPEPAHAPK